MIMLFNRSIKVPYSLSPFTLLIIAFFPLHSHALLPYPPLTDTVQIPVADIFNSPPRVGVAIVERITGFFNPVVFSVSAEEGERIGEVTWTLDAPQGMDYSRDASTEGSASTLEIRNIDELSTQFIGTFRFPHDM